MSVSSLKKRQNHKEDKLMNEYTDSVCEFTPFEFQLDFKMTLYG